MYELYDDAPKFVSTFERFSRLMDEFTDLGKWRIKRLGSRYFDDVLKATLSGANGMVEVWGGEHHRCEVWFIGRDKSEKLVAVNCHKTSSLREAIVQACNLAGVQGRLFDCGS